MGQRTRKLEAPHGIECVSLDADPRARHRRARLEELVTGQQRIFPVRRPAPNGLDARAEVLRRGYEGYVGKNEASPYAGAVTRSWLKVRRDREAEDLGGLEVHDKPESIRAVDRKLGRWGPLQNHPGK